MNNQITYSNPKAVGFSISQWLIILFYGTLVGLNESFIGGLSIPYRSIIVNILSISLLSLARYRIPKPGSSFIILTIAILYKINNLGFHSCTANVFLCSPLALVILGLSFELISFITTYYISPKSKINLPLTAAASALLSFSLFGFTNTFILGVWEMPKLLEFIFFKGLITSISSLIIVMIGFQIQKSLQTLQDYPELHPKAKYGFVVRSVVIAALWIAGSVITF